ncbi:hypothetical protein [Chryseobacterium sp. WLY505]|uniref:hypothetical protein n=1 Tax=Chryseobacterium sp. WLY505 TaxID=3068892 RepID=UPI0027969B14|nr:hypothetical protein [Chryseobacterium sp. WLY505]MDQ1855727.1 hypothetical protein [Chryseobacterium sp. WLY505]
MQKTKYLEVKPSDRLPSEKGEYIAVIDPETNFAGFYSFDPEDPADVEWWKETPEYYLEEKPDYEEEMKEVLAKCMLEFGRFKAELGKCSKLELEIKSLLTKLKT